MYDGKKITSYSLSPESKGEVDYVSKQIAVVFNRFVTLNSVISEEDSETGDKPNDCGGSNEVKIPFESEEEGGFGTDTGRLTGEFNSAENDRDDPSTHENWPPIPSECRNND